MGIRLDRNRSNESNRNWYKKPSKFFYCELLPFPQTNLHRHGKLTTTVKIFQAKKHNRKKHPKCVKRNYMNRKKIASSKTYHPLDCWCPVSSPRTRFNITTQNIRRKRSNGENDDGADKTRETRQSTQDNLHTNNKNRE